MKIACPTCKGIGTVPLSPELKQTLNVVSFSNWRSTAEIFGLHDGRSKAGKTAINNRLVSLLKKGAVRVRATKRDKFWRRRK